MRAQAAVRTTHAALPGGRRSEVEDLSPRDLFADRDAGVLSGRHGNPAHGESVRAWSWDEALWFIGQARREGEETEHGTGLPSPGIKFVHGVPEALRHIGCMWLPDGHEDRRCGKRPAWTMGANLNLARVYCEMHGRMIERRRAQIRTVRKLRRLARG